MKKFSMFLLILCCVFLALAGYRKSLSISNLQEVADSAQNSELSITSDTAVNKKIAVITPIYDSIVWRVDLSAFLAYGNDSMYCFDKLGNPLPVSMFDSLLVNNKSYIKNNPEITTQTKKSEFSEQVKKHSITLAFSFLVLFIIVIIARQFNSSKQNRK